MGVDCALAEAAAFDCLAVTEELTENEFDHVFVGVWDGTPSPDPAEVAEWDWRAPEELARELQTHSRSVQSMAATRLGGRPRKCDGEGQPPRSGPKVEIAMTGIGVMIAILVRC
jgi:hypothetical protein